MSAYFHSYLCGRKAAEWLIDIKKTKRGTYMIQSITFAQGKHILDTVPGSTLVDVRTEDEYGAEHAAGAVLLPLEDIEDADLDSVLPNKDAPVLLYCRTGRRSALAAAQLFDQGYTRLYDLGGLNGWPYGMEYGLL